MLNILTTQDHIMTWITKTLPSPEGVLLKLIKAPLSGKILQEKSSPEEGLHQQYLIW